MGIFGGLGRRLKDGRLVDGLAIAGATLRGDYGNVAAIQTAARQRLDEREKRARLVQAIASDPGLSAQARAYAELDPDRFLSALLQARPDLLGAQRQGPELDRTQLGSMVTSGAGPGSAHYRALGGP